MIYGISCNSCDYERRFFAGPIRSSQKAELAKRAQTGEFGSVVKYLLSDECSLVVEAHKFLHLSRCEACSAPISWESISVSCPEDNQFMSLEPLPDMCPRREAGFIEEPSLFIKEIPSRYELLGWLFEMSDRPCPKCGQWSLAVSHC